MHNTLRSLLAGHTLGATEAEAMMEAVIAGGVDELQIAALLGAWRSRGETTDELTGAARAILAHCDVVDTGIGNAIDVCGTGGDGSNTFNISTTVALVAAGAGIPVAKHGNRAVSSASGSADVLEALGVPINSDPTAVAQSLGANGFGFFFAPSFHRVLRSVALLRRRIGARTTFNLLGPLMNPARVRRQLVGVFDMRMAQPVAETLRSLGVSDAIVVASYDGLDELSISAPTHMVRLQGGTITRIMVSAGDAGLKSHPLEDIVGGDARANAAITTAVLNGDPGAARDVVLLNAAAALLVAGVCTDLLEGAHIAAESIDSGTALSVLKRLQSGANHAAA